MSRTSKCIAQRCAGNLCSFIYRIRVSPSPALSLWDSLHTFQSLRAVFHSSSAEKFEIEIESRVLDFHSTPVSDDCDWGLRLGKSHIKKRTINPEIHLLVGSFSISHWLLFCFPHPQHPCILCSVYLYQWKR